MICLLAACGGEDPNAPTDNLSSGTIDISVDETYKPIIDEQIKVFDSAYPDAHIRVHYKSEAACINDFLHDSARLILITRDLLPAEKENLEKRKIVPTAIAVAKDAVALVVPVESTDTGFSVSQIKGILTGTYKKKYTVVFDHQGSSTVRYMVDSLIPGQKLGANVYAAQGNDSVIAYVRRNPNAIGFVGVSYVSDYADPEGLAFIQNVRVAQVYNDSLGEYFLPYQGAIAPDYYPLTRSLFYIHRETYPGLGTGFANFLYRERGQLIFKQSRLFPLHTNVIFRDVSVNPE